MTLKTKIKTKNLKRFIPFFIYIFLFKVAAVLHWSTVAVYGEKVFPIWLVGLLVGSVSIVQFLMDLPVGNLLDKVGFRRLLKITTIALTFAGFAYTFGLSAETYILSLIAATLGWLFYDPGVSAYSLSESSEHSSSKFFSLVDTSSSLGAVISSIPFIFLINSKVELMGMVITLFLLFSYVALILTPRESKSNQSPSHSKAAQKSSHPDAISLHKAFPPLTMLCLVYLAAAIFYGTVYFILPLEVSKGFMPANLSLGISIFDLTIVLMGFFIGKIAGKHNQRTMIFFGLLLFSVGATLLSFNFNWLFLLFGFLATTGEEMSKISLWSWLHSLDHAHTHDGRLTSRVIFFQDVGWAAGPILSGFLYTWIGPSFTIAITAGFIFLTWIIYQITLHRRPAAIKKDGHQGSHPIHKRHPKTHRHKH